MAFSQTRRFHRDYNVVFNTAEDILWWMGFDVRYRNPWTGRLLCHSDSDSTGAHGYFEVTVTEGTDIVRVRAEADSYHIWSNSKFLNIMGWFFYHMDAWLGEGKGTPDDPPVMYGDKVSGPFEPSANVDRPRDVMQFEPPSRTKPMLLALVPVLIMLGMASFQVESADDVLVVLGFMSPFILGSLLIGTGFFRPGGALCMVFGIFAGLVFGIFAWLLIFGFGQYAGRQAMISGRWWTYYKQMLEEPKVTKV